MTTTITRNEARALIDQQATRHGRVLAQGSGGFFDRTLTWVHADRIVADATHFLLAPHPAGDGILTVVAPGHDGIPHCTQFLVLIPKEH